MISWSFNYQDQVIKSDLSSKWNPSLSIKEVVLELAKYKFIFKLPESQYKLQEQVVVSGDERHHVGYRFVYKVPKELKGKFIKLFNLNNNFFIGEVKEKEKESYYIPKKSKELIFILKPNSRVSIQIK